ncbi:hypothetical protein [Devosia sp. 2618]|uniref:hypothetical protein n=1 Tax=Devosia sp. 2618 TaxID=3156454 RepID=UPI00339131EE
MAKGAGRYLVGQRLSDYQIEKMIKAYAEGLTGSEALRALPKRGGRAPNTVFKLYALIRKRLTDIRYYPNPKEYLDWLASSDARYTFASSRTLKELERLLPRLHGASEETAHDLFAEILFLAENPDQTPTALFNEIKLAVKITGPLNRDPENLDIWHHRAKGLMLMRSIRQMRGMMESNPDYHRKMIADYQVMLEKSEARLKKLMRERIKPKN